MRQAVKIERSAMAHSPSGNPALMRPAVGVVIPVRNRPSSIVNAINSVLCQSVPAKRIVVVDDGSTDSTAREIQQATRNAENLEVVTIPHSGPSTARNIGLKTLDGLGVPDTSDPNLVAFLDSDDIWPPDFLQRAQQRLLESPELGFVVSDRQECFHPSGPRLRSASCFDTDPWFALRRQSPQIMSCAVFRRSVLADRPFPEGSFIGEDSALLIKLLAEQAKSAWIPGEPVVASSIPPGDLDRLTSKDRSSRQLLQDRIGSAEAYENALRESSGAIPKLLAGRLLAARWVAALGHSVTARNRNGAARSLKELRRCGGLATALGVLDQCYVLADLNGKRRKDSRFAAEQLRRQS
jgi:hypothetical protein